MKRVCQQIIFSILGVLICVSLSGCAIGGYHVFDAYIDENDGQHFMGFGKTGPSGGEESIENDNSTQEVDDAQENENSIEELGVVQENENNYNPESIVGTSLK